MFQTRSTGNSKKTLRYLERRLSPLDFPYYATDCISEGVQRLVLQTNKFPEQVFWPNVE